MQIVLILVAWMFSALAGASTFTVCDTEIKTADERVTPTRIEVLDLDTGAVARITQTLSARRQSYRIPVKISELTVRPNLATETRTEDFNVAEHLILHAMTLEANEEMRDTQNAGMDLSAIRTAKVYVIVRSAQRLIGIVEAADGEGKSLGSFLGGYWVASCRQ